MGHFLKVWATHFLSNVAQILVEFEATLKNATFKQKHSAANFWATLDKIGILWKALGFFLFQHLLTTVSELRDFALFDASYLCYGKTFLSY